MVGVEQMYTDQALPFDSTDDLLFAAVNVLRHYLSRRHGEANNGWVPLTHAEVHEHYRLLGLRVWQQAIDIGLIDHTTLY
jgi:hypothetical protein